MPDPGSELSGAPAAIGLYGKMPAHGDFVRRALPGSFVAPWDAWLAAGIAAARDRLGDGFATAWDEAPAWRFALPAGICGPDAVAGVMLPSADTVGRRFPLTVAALLPRGRAPSEEWFAGVEARAREAREGRLDADALTRVLAEAGRSDATPPPALPEEALLGLFGGPPDAPTAPSDVAEPPAAAAAPAEEVPAEAWLHLFAEGKPEAGPAAQPAETLAPAGHDDAPPVEAWLDLLGKNAAAEPGTPAPEPGTDKLPPAEGWLDLLGGTDQGAAATQDGSTPAAPTDEAEPPPAAWLDLLGDDDAKDPGTDAPDAERWDELLDAVPAPPAAADLSLALFGEVPASQPEPAEPSPPAANAASADEDAPFIEPPAPEVPLLPGSDDAVPAAMEALGTAADQPPSAADAAAQVPAPPPERPDQGGWWTLGGGRLPAMVWALPALPPPEAFVLLLETEA